MNDTTPPTAATLLEDVIRVICHANATDATKREAVMIAYEVGKSEGRCEGAASMGDHMLETLDTATAKIFKGLVS